MRNTFGTAPLSALQILEIVLVLICVGVAYLKPTVAVPWFEAIESKLKLIAARPKLCAVILFLFPIAARLLLLPVYAPPTPFIHDEYAYLLQADTFASGRITNPPPPLAKHFSSIYVLTQPSYTAEYQPAQAMTLAAGQALTGCPWTGALLTAGFFFVAFYWAMRVWVSPVWALIGTLIMEISFGVLGYWTNSYWGGSVPGIGGALVLGSLPRLRINARPTTSLLLGAGLAILFNSRPLEAVLLSVITIVSLLYWSFFQTGLPPRKLLVHILAPLALLFLPVILFAGYYNTRVTGQPARFPYLLYRAQYGLPQGFFWQQPVQAKSRLPIDIQEEYDAQLKMHERRTSIKSLLLATGGKVRSFWEFYIGVPLSLPLLCLPFVWRGPYRRLAALTILLVVGFGNFTFFAYFPHYSAAAAVAIYVVLFDCLRCLRWRGEAGLSLSRTLPLICLLGLCIPMVGRSIEPLLPAGACRMTELWDSEFEQWNSRERFVPRLQSDQEKHLVLVRYNPRRHENDDAWVYNRADIEHAKIVWARELDPESNRQLLLHFPGRRLWLALPDERPQRIIPYSAPDLRP